MRGRGRGQSRGGAGGHDVDRAIGRGRGRGASRELPPHLTPPPSPPRRPSPTRPPPSRGPPSPELSRHEPPTISHSPRAPIRYRIPEDEKPIPFGLGVCGFDKLEVLSTGNVTLQDIKWLDVDSARQPGDSRSIVGVAPAFFEDGKALLGVALSTATRVLFVDCASWKARKHEAKQSCDLLEHEIFTSSSVLCVGFDFALVSIGIRQWLRDITGVDVSSVGATSPASEARSPAGVVHSLFGRERLSNLVTLWQFNSRKDEGEDHGATYSALRAWLARCCAVHPTKWDAVRTARELDTRRVGWEQVAFFSEAHFVNTRLEALKPRFTKAEFSSALPANAKGEIAITNSKFSTKLRQDAGQTLRITSSDGTTYKNVVATSMKGKQTVVQGKQGQPGMEVVEIEVIGRASGTLADELYLTGALDASIGVYDSEHVTRVFWAASRRQKARRSTRPEGDQSRNDDLPVSPAAERLNPSQRQAHDAIVAPPDPGSTLVITGPPGTGKTSVISASVRTWLLRNDAGAIYCCTSSNVAARNIADSLSRSGFTDFRLIVSGDYLIDWHEHRYALGKNLVVSNALKPTLKQEELDKLMGGVRVILCTIAMLSSNNLEQNGFFATFKMRTLLCDEASQLRIDQYPHVFHRFRASLERVAFFGDAQQLAPYNSGQIREIRSIFDLKHLDAFFLDTQYRMPKKMGRFISQHVYGSRLKSAESTSDDQQCIKFVDVQGSEERSGTSTKNDQEIKVVVDPVRQYYSSTNFKILTPYDAQRNEIEARLKSASLPWEDKMFNVDSFQGQEEDIILVSIVKTSKLGFLTELRRCNVMLTRLKRAIVIVTNQRFIQNLARNTLLGKLASAVAPSSEWITERACLAGTAPLPERGPARKVEVHSVAGVKAGPDPDAPPLSVEEQACLDDWGVSWDTVGDGVDTGWV